jgi:hypothetical protein
MLKVRMIKEANSFLEVGKLNSKVRRLYLMGSPIVISFFLFKLIYI